MLFKKKIVTPDMVDWHENPTDLMLHKAHGHLTACRHLAKRPLVVFVGGALDDYFQPMLQGVFIPYRLRNRKQQDSCYATHACRNQLLPLVQQWKQAGQKVCFVGHSWGGKTVFDVARQLAPEVTVDLLVTLDPVAWRMSIRTPRKPANVTEWLNVHVDYTRASMEYSNTVARLGGYWGHCRHADRNIPLFVDDDQEITHAMAGRMFQEVAHRVQEL